jgi:hypothetical protein
MLEQIGYLIRFDITYCEKKHYNAEKCKKKRTKYGERFDYALELYKHPVKTKRSAVGILNSQSLQKEVEKNMLLNDNIENPFFSDTQIQSAGKKRKTRKSKRRKTRKSKRRKTTKRKNRKHDTRKHVKL